MRKTSLIRLLFMIAILIFAGRSQAQYRQFGIGSSDNEVAVRVRTLPDGTGTVIAGYRYAPLAPGATDITNAQMILLKVNPSGTSILWQQEFGIAGTNNLIQDMLITHDGDIVVVGTMGRSGVHLENNAAILKFNSTTGALSWQSSFRSNPGVPTNGGEIFLGVTELGASMNHALVAVGAYDNRPVIADNLLSIFDNATGAHIHSERHCSIYNVSESYNGICTGADGETVYIVGSFRSGVYGDGVIRSFHIDAITPAVTLLWHKYFNFVLPGVDPQNPLHLDNNTFSQVFLRNDKLMIMGGSLNAFTTTGGSGENILRINAADGSSPELWQIQHGTSPYAGPTRIYPTSTVNVLNVQSPTTAWFDPIIWLTGVTPTSSLSNANLNTGLAGTIEFVTNNPSLHALYDIDADGANANFYFAGCTNDTDGNGNNDIYFVDQLTTTHNKGCLQPQNATIIPVTPNETPNNYTVNTVAYNPVLVTPVTPDFHIKSLCINDTSKFECNGLTFDEAATSLTDSGSYTDTGGCGFVVTATGITTPGWSIIGYLWTYGSTTLWSPSTSSTDIQTIILSYSGTETVHVKFFAVNAHGDTCYTDRTLKLHCKRPPCYFDTCSKLTVTQLIAPLGGGGTTSGIGDSTSNPNDDSCTFTACVNVCTAYNILGYSWTLSNGTSVTHHNTTGTDCWTFRIGPGEVVTVSVVAHIVDPNFPDGGDPCCRAAFEQEVSCKETPPNGCDCFDEPNVTLTSSLLTSTLRECRFQVTATAAMLNPNCQIISYEWVEAGSSTVVYTSAMSDTRTIIVPTGTGMTVDVYINAISPTGETCTVHKSIYLSCNENPGSNCNCFDDTQSGIYGTFIVTGGDGSCNYDVSGYTALSGNCNVFAHQWTVNGIAHPMVFGSALFDILPVNIPFGTSSTISITFFAISPTGDTCTITKTITIDCDHMSRPSGDKGTGLNDAGKSGANIINVFPNPASDAVTVTSSEINIRTIDVIDVNGKKVGEYTFNNVKTANIPLQKLVPGAYMLKVNSNTTKVVIKGSGK